MVDPLQVPVVVVERNHINRKRFRFDNARWRLLIERPRILQFRADRQIDDREPHHQARQRHIHEPHPFDAINRLVKHLVRRQPLPQIS